MLLCAKCPRTPLRKVKSTKGYLYECPRCQGRALSFSLQETIGGESAFRSFLAEIDRTKIPGTAHCPNCIKPMLGLFVPQPFLHIDACKICKLSWFDRDEVKQYQKGPSNRTALLSTDSPDQFWKLIPGILRLPVEHTNLLTSAPWLTYVFILIMVGVHVLLVNPDPETSIAHWAFLPQDPWRNYGLTWLTSLFMHGGWIHLILNSYFLLLFGDNVEDSSSRFSYFVLFLLAGLAGTALHGFMDPRADLPLVGASGAISGIMLVYCLRFPWARLAKFFFITWLSFPAWAFFVFWLVFQILGFFDQTAGLTMVSYSAHLGGAVAGLLYWFTTRDRGAFKLR